MLAIYKTKKQKISNILLFLLIIFINLREPFFHLRELFFFLFIIFSFDTGNYKKIFPVLLLLSIWGISITYNIFVPGSNISKNWYETLIVSCYLFLIIFSIKRYEKVIIASYLISGIIVSFLTIAVWTICMVSEPIRNALVLYFAAKRESSNLNWFLIGGRYILSYPFFTVYYRTVPCLIPSLCFCFNSRLYGKNKRNLLLILLYTCALIFSGARANILAVFLLYFVYLFFYCIEKKYINFAMIIAVISIFSAIFFALAFLNDGTHSTTVKLGHKASYYELFNTDYIRTVFFGWGMGSTFFSKGKGAFVDVTELTHLELVRRYGFISTLAIFVIIWLKPFWIKLKENGVRKYNYLLMIVSYIIVACTNPFLMDSLGFTALLFYSVYFEMNTDTKPFVFFVKRKNRRMSISQLIFKYKNPSKGGILI